MSYQHLSFSIDSGIAKIVLDRPKAGNTFNIDIAKEFEEVTRLCAFDKSVRVVVLTGNGKLFSGGGDLAYMLENEDALDVAIKALADSLHTSYSTLGRMKAPLLVAANGTAAGIGLNLALMGDITIAVEEAKFVASYTDVGLSPDGGLTYLLPRLVGVKRAKELIYTNRRLSAQEALDWGMITKVVSADKFEEEVDAMAKKLASGPSKSYGDVKALLNSSENESMESQMHLEALALASNAMSVDGKEGISAFANNRKPNFS